MERPIEKGIKRDEKLCHYWILVIITINIAVALLSAFSK